MSDDPWRVTPEDVKAYRNFATLDTSHEDDIQFLFDRVRARVEAAASKQPTTTESPERIKIGRYFFCTDTIKSGGFFDREARFHVTGWSESIKLTAAEAAALWSYLTDPSRCVDLTPESSTEDA